MNITNWEELDKNRSSWAQVFSKSIHEIYPKDPMLLYTKEAVYPAIQVDTLTGQNCQGESSYSCSHCGELFRSKIAIRHHKTYSCTAAIPGYSSLAKQMSPIRHALTDGSSLGAVNCSRDETDDNNDCSNNVSNENESDDNNSDDSYQEPAETGSSGEFRCEECPKSFQWKANLQRHQLTHDADRKFPCENCVKVFTDPSNLQRHIRSQHVGARCHACTECGKTFATSSGLKQHHHIHSSVKPFQCEVCLKSYTQFSNLCRHKRMHADCRQQIKCQDCSQAFSTVTSLSKHKRFCEGFMRNGMRIIYPCEKVPLISPNGQTPAHLSQALFPDIYAQNLPSRSQYPFSSYHPFGTFPNLLPGGLPAMLGVSPVSHSDALRIAASMQHSNTAAFNHSHETGYIDKNTPGFMHLTEQTSMIARPSEMSSFEQDDSNDSELDVSSSSNDDYENSNHLKRVIRSSPDIMSADLSISHNAVKIPKLELVSSPLSSLDNKQIRQTRIVPPDGTCSTAQYSNGLSNEVTPAHRVQSSATVNNYLSSDISNAAVKLQHPSPPLFSKTVTPDTPSQLSDNDFYSRTDCPLDLSTKPCKSVRALQNEPTRKTHIYGDDAVSPTSSSSSSSSSTSPAASSKTAVTSALSLPTSSMPIVNHQTSIPCHFTYPFSPAMVESFLRMKEDMKLQLDPKQELSHPFSQFLIPNPAAFQNLNPRHLSIRSGRNVDIASSSMHERETYDSPEHFHGHQTHHNFPPQHFGQALAGKSKERYVCKYCGKVFPRSANLTRHLRTHTGEQPYKCKYCERSFSISSNLQRHVRNIHNREKPFKCQLCDRCFGQQTNLDRHLKKHDQVGDAVSESPTAELEERKVLIFSDNTKIDDNGVDSEDNKSEKIKKRESTSSDSPKNSDQSNKNGNGMGNAEKGDPTDDTNISDDENLPEKVIHSPKQMIHKSDILVHLQIVNKCGKKKRNKKDDKLSDDKQLKAVFAFKS